MQFRGQAVSRQSCSRRLLRVWCGSCRVQYASSRITLSAVAEKACWRRNFSSPQQRARRMPVTSRAWSMVPSAPAGRAYLAFHFSAFCSARTRTRASCGSLGPQGWHVPAQRGAGALFLEGAGVTGADAEGDDDDDHVRAMLLHRVSSARCSYRRHRGPGGLSGRWRRCSCRSRVTALAWAEWSSRTGVTKRVPRFRTAVMRSAQGSRSRGGAGRVSPVLGQTPLNRHGRLHIGHGGVGGEHVRDQVRSAGAPASAGVPQVSVRWTL